MSPHILPFAAALVAMASSALFLFGPLWPLPQHMAVRPPVGDGSKPSRENAGEGPATSLEHTAESKMEAEPMVPKYGGFIEEVASQNHTEGSDTQGASSWDMFELQCDWKSVWNNEETYECKSGQLSTTLKISPRVQLYYFLPSYVSISTLKFGDYPMKCEATRKGHLSSWTPMVEAKEGGGKTVLGFMRDVYTSSESVVLELLRVAQQNPFEEIMQDYWEGVKGRWGKTESDLSAENIDTIMGSELEALVEMCEEKLKVELDNRWQELYQPPIWPKALKDGYMGWLEGTKTTLPLEGEMPEAKDKQH